MNKIFTGDYKLTKLQSNFSDAILRIGRWLNFLFESNKDGSLNLAITSVIEAPKSSAIYEIAIVDCKLELIILSSPAATDQRIVLPTANKVTNKKYTIKKMSNDVGNVIVSALIDNVQDYTISTQYDFITVVSNGSQFIKV